MDTSLTPTTASSDSRPCEENEKKKTRKRPEKLRKKEKSAAKSAYSVQKGALCQICIQVSKTKSKHQEERKQNMQNVVLSIIGESDNYLPNESVKNLLKSGLNQLIKTTNTWVITEGESTCVGQIVKDVIQMQKETSQSGVLHKGFETNIKHEEHTRQTLEDSYNKIDTIDMESCITDCRKHRDFPLIMIIVGGDASSFQTAMTFLKRNFHIVVIEGSGRVADFISKGYKMSTTKSRYERSIWSDSFENEMSEAAKKICGPYNKQRFIDKNACEQITKQLLNVLRMNRENIHVHLLNDTSYTLDMTIQDILLQLILKDAYKEKAITDKILELAGFWNRPDIVKNKIFFFENRKVLQTLQGDLARKESSLSKLFVHSLVKDRVEFVEMVLEYVLERDHYRCFLENHLEYLYMNTICIGGYFISTHLNMLKQKTKRYKTTVEMINNIVIQILGSKHLKPFNEGLYCLQLVAFYPVFLISEGL